ncbi:MAG: murein biosynthesis integral membrane protein MurJ [Pseudobdellovibrio sp.]
MKNALKMAFGTMASRVLGQLRESLLAAYFDKRITDAWGAAFRLPNLFRRLLGEGSLSVSFIPVFVEARLDSDVRAQNLVNSVYSFLLLILGCLTTFGILHPEPLLKMVLDPSYILDTEKYLLTLRLTKMMFGFIFFVSSYAFMMGILNALGQFSLPALAPTLWNLAMIISTVLPNDWFPVRGDQLGWGVLIGGMLQAGILVPALIKAGFFPKLSFDIRNKDFQKVMRNMVPGLLGMGLLQFTTIVNLRFSSSLHEGTISYINYVDRLIELPLSLISVSLGTALLPMLSGLFSKNEKHRMSEVAQNYLELNLLLAMAAAAGLFSLAEPIVQLLFGRGQFKLNDVLETADILRTYCWIMIFSSAVRVLTPAYYAIKNTWFPAVVSAICLTVHIILAPILMGQWQVRGLMISTTISAMLNLFLLLVFFPRFVIGFHFKSFFKKVIIFAVLATLTGAVAHVFYVLRPLLPAGIFGLIFGLVFSVFVAISAFVWIGRLFGVTQIEDIVQKLLKRLRKV